MGKLLIDCDPGIDDFIAILEARYYRPDDIVALTTCFGNSNVQVCTRNALDLLAFLRLDIAVAQGAEAPLIETVEGYSKFHGENGLGNAEFIHSVQLPCKDYAWDLIYQMACRYPQELDIVVLGPATNLAIALMKYEDLPEKINKVVLMAGSTTNGNAAPFGEANVQHDPHAYDLIFKTDMDITMVGLNVTESVALDISEYNRIFAAADYLKSPFSQMAQYYRDVQICHGERRITIHDAVAMMVAIRPDFAQIAKFHVEVETNHTAMGFRTIVDMRFHSEAEKNVNVVLNADSDQFKMFLEEAITTLAWKG